MTGAAGALALLAVLPWLTRRSAARLASRPLQPAEPRAATRRGSLDGPDPATGRGSLDDLGAETGRRWLDGPGGLRVPGRLGRGRWRRPGRRSEGDAALLLDLVAVALAAGAPVPTALTAVGAAWPGRTGQAMTRAGRALTLGAAWAAAWAGADGGALALAEALGPAWLAGASPVPVLRAAADRVRARRRAAARAAAGRLGVQLVVPLGLCYLPAFVLVGLVPVVLSLAGGVLG